MDDQVRVRVADGGEHLEHEPDPIVARELAAGGEDVDALALDVLQHEVRLTAAAHARVEQARDPGMGEPREHRALAAESLLADRSQEREVEQLDRRASLEPAVGAAREPHGAHAALPERCSRI